jgi:hypothetical protein
MHLDDRKRDAIPRVQGGRVKHAQTQSHAKETAEGGLHRQHRRLAMRDGRCARESGQCVRASVCVSDSRKCIHEA